MPKRRRELESSIGKHRKFGQPGAFGNPRYTRPESALLKQAGAKKRRYLFGVGVAKLKKLSGLVRSRWSA